MCDGVSTFLPYLPWSTVLISYAQQQNIKEGRVKTAFVCRAPPVVSPAENNEGTNFSLFVKMM